MLNIKKRGSIRKKPFRHTKNYVTRKDKENSKRLLIILLNVIKIKYTVHMKNRD